MGQRSIVLWPEWTRDDGGIEDVLRSPRRWEVVSNTLICILWLFSQPLEKPLSAMETRRQINERCDLLQQGMK
jgi:hypothetical protein